MAGRKVWTEETLSVVDMQEYLQDQTVMTFASSAARSAAITDPTDGMVTYLEDTDVLEMRRNGAWGSIWPLTSHAPASYAASFGQNAVTPLAVTVDPNKRAVLSGMVTNTGATAITNLVGTWFTLPAAAAPTSLRTGLCHIEGGGLASYSIATTGVVAGLQYLVGSYPIPTGRYWSFPSLNYPVP